MRLLAGLLDQDNKVMGRWNQQTVVSTIIAGGALLPWLTITAQGLVLNPPLEATLDRLRDTIPFFGLSLVCLAVLWTVPFIILALLARRLMAPPRSARPVYLGVLLAAFCGFCFLLVPRFGMPSMEGSVAVALLSYGIISIRSWGLFSVRARLVFLLSGLGGGVLGTLVVYGFLLPFALFGFFDSLVAPLAVLGVVVGALFVGFLFAKYGDRTGGAPTKAPAAVEAAPFAILTNAAAGAVGTPAGVLLFSALPHSPSLSHESVQLLLNVTPELVFGGGLAGWVCGLLIYAGRTLAGLRVGRRRRPLVRSILALLPGLVVGLAPGVLGERVFVALVANDYFTLLNRGVHPIQSVASSPDGSRVVADVGHVLYVWDARSADLLWHTDYEPRSVSAPADRLAYSPDGLRIAVVSNQSGVILLDSDTGGQLMALDPAADNIAPSDRISDVSFSPNSQRIVVAFTNGTVAVSDVASGLLIDKWSAPVDGAAIRSAEFSPNGSFVAIGGSYPTKSDRHAGFLALIVVDTGKAAYLVNDFEGTVGAVSFSPDGARLLSVEPPKQVRVWDTIQRQPLTTLRHQCGALLDATFLADGKNIVVRCMEDTIETCDAKSGECSLLFRLSFTRITAVSAHPDAAFFIIAEGSRSVSVWNWRTRAATQTLRIPSR